MKNFMNLEMFYAAACLVYIISGLFLWLYTLDTYVSPVR